MNLIDNNELLKYRAVMKKHGLLDHSIIVVDINRYWDDFKIIDTLTAMFSPEVSVGTTIEESDETKKQIHAFRQGAIESKKVMMVPLLTNGPQRECNMGALAETDVYIVARYKKGHVNFYFMKARGVVDKTILPFMKENAVSISVK